MENFIKYFTPAIMVFSFLSATASAELKFKTDKLPNGNVKVTMDDGKVYINPKVVGRTPEGLEIGHKNGIIFVPFTEFPEKIQKKYHYDPQAAKTYAKSKAQAKQQALAERQRKAREAEASRRNLEKRREQYRKKKGAEDVRALKKRIAYLKQQIPVLEKQANRYRKDLNASKSFSDRRNNHQYSWRGGVVYSSAGKNEARRNRKLTDNLSDGYLDCLNKLKAYREELADKEAELKSLQPAKPPQKQSNHT